MRPITDADRIYVLALTHALIQEGWCKDRFTDRFGQSPWRPWEFAGAWCLTGALHVAAETWSAGQESDDEADLDLFDSVTAFLKATCAPYSLASYNDAPQRRKRDVLRLVESAAERIGK